jgi:type IV pilus assembly protein PilC
VFSRTFCQAIAAGEQGGSLEIVLRQMADYVERNAAAVKKIKSALTYPIIVVVAAFAVVTLLVTFVLPSFSSLYSVFGANVPTTTKVMLDLTEWLSKYGIYIAAGMVVAVLILFAYTRSPAGRYQWDVLMLKLPVIGRIVALHEQARCCRTISLLFKVGVPIPEIMAMVVQGTGNRVVKANLEEVREELIRGEGLFKPMSKRPIFMPLMVQMVGVGEETGNLDSTLTTVARSYEDEADDRTSSAIGLIQPIITVVIGVVVAFIALALANAMYGIYGQMG